MNTLIKITLFIKHLTEEIRSKIYRDINDLLEEYGTNICITFHEDD